MITRERRLLLLYQTIEQPRCTLGAHLMKQLKFGVLETKTKINEI